MGSNCYGPHPVRSFEAFLKRVDESPNYQFELFSVLEDQYWYGDGWKSSTFFHLFPYDYAIKYVRSFYEAS